MIVTCFEAVRVSFCQLDDTSNKNYHDSHQLGHSHHILQKIR